MYQPSIKHVFTKKNMVIYHVEAHTVASWYGRHASKRSKSSARNITTRSRWPRRIGGTVRWWKTLLTWEEYMGVCQNLWIYQCEWGFPTHKSQLFWCEQKGYVWFWPRAIWKNDLGMVNCPRCWFTMFTGGYPCHQFHGWENGEITGITKDSVSIGPMG